MIKTSHTSSILQVIFTCPSFTYQLPHVTSHDYYINLATCRSQCKESELSLLGARISQGTPVYQLVPEEKRAWHAGVSHWRGMEALNAHSIGVEIVNLGPNTTTPTPTTDGHDLWHPYPESQVQAVIELCKDILQRHTTIPPRNVVGHSDVAPTRKIDPGALFPWKRLAEDGIGLWYSPLPTDDALRLRAPGARTPCAAWCQSALRAWGYKVGDKEEKKGEGEVMDAETRSAVAAFQLHFRPSKFDGNVDEETCNILESLLIEHNIKL